MYDTLARHYDQLHRHLDDDVPLLLNLAQQRGGPILELGCGTGRLLVPLASAGHTIVGVDNSAAMLDGARRRLAAVATPVAERVTLIEADMLALPQAVQEQQYGLIVVPYNTLLHFREHEIAQILRQVVRMLLPEGRVFIDLVSPFALDERVETPVPILEQTWTDPQSGLEVQQWSQSQLDTAVQQLAVTWQFRTAAMADGETVAMVYYYYYPHQLDLLLHNAGLQLDRMLGDYSGESFAEESERLLLLARLA